MTIRKNYDAALEDLQNENWDAARDAFRTIVDHKGTLKDEAKKRLDKIASAQNAIDSISELTRSHSYRGAKSKLDNMQDGRNRLSGYERRLFPLNSKNSIPSSLTPNLCFKNKTLAGSNTCKTNWVTIRVARRMHPRFRSADELNQNLK